VPLVCRFTVQAEVKVTTKEHIMDLVNSETRIILLYTTKVSSANQTKYESMFSILNTYRPNINHGYLKPGVILNPPNKM
jgi:hypothetical protein